MNVTAIPGRPLCGAIHLPGDKSLSHRAAILGAMALGESHIRNFLVAGVTHPLLEALSMLGIPWTLEDTHLIMHGSGMDGFRPPTHSLDCGNSATVLRLLAGALSATGIAAILDGSPRLRCRPMNRIIDPLTRMGVPIRATPEGTAPLALSPRPRSQPLRPITYRLPVASAQVKSCLLLAALAADGQTTLIEHGPSRDHTERMLRSMGVDVHTETNVEKSGKQPEFTITLTPLIHNSLVPLQLDLPGDFSSAAFLIVAALITPGSDILIQEVGLNPTRIGLLEALQSMGADIKIDNLRESCGEPVGDLHVRHQALYGTTVEGSLVVRMIDEFPAFAIAAVFAQGQTCIRDAEELRYKESDRISALGQELRTLGVRFEETPDGFSITGGASLPGGSVNSHGDHRLAMSLLLAGLAGDSHVTVQDAEVISESFPDFLTGIQSLGGHLEWDCGENHAT